MSVLLSFFLILRPAARLYGAKMGERYPPDNLGNFGGGDKSSYVVGIPLSPSTFYVDHPSENRNNVPPSDLAVRKRTGTSFQITSVTVQGSRRNNDECDDSADDYDESHTDDISSDILDSSKFTEPDGYQSEENTNTNCEDLSPCGPLIITTIDDSSMNVGLGINMSPPFPAMGPSMVSSGVTMMTSSSESPVSAQVSINPLPDNWQHRFKVVKIVSSEPFKKGRWVCMDFKDPPHPPEAKMDIPTIQVTPSGDSNNNNNGLGSVDHQLSGTNNTVAHVYQIPFNSACAGNVFINNQQNQSIYGIFLPQNGNGQYGTINEMSVIQHVANNNSINAMQNQNEHQTTHSYNFPVPVEADLQNYVPLPSVSNGHVQQFMDNNANRVDPRNGHEPVLINGTSTGYPPSVSANADQALVSATNPVMVPSDKAPSRFCQVECTESFCSLASELCRASGLPQSPPTQPKFVASWQQDCCPPANVVAPAFTTAVPPNVAAATVTAVEPSSSSEPSLHQLPVTSLPSASNDAPTVSAASSGTSTVAIDNKIEQAMDLVKSHLMFAVREEVEVLKEKITELLERISQLEHENDILRANASPETLKQLNQSQKKFSGHPMIGKQIVVPHGPNQPPSS